MTYATEHRRLRPVLDLARKLDIATNPDPQAIFKAGNAGLQIWATREDHPRGWESVLDKLQAGAFSKPCGYVASVHWGWDEEVVTHLVLSTTAYDLGDCLPDEHPDRLSYTNRAEDVVWSKQNIGWLFNTADVSQPPIVIGKD